MILSLLVFVVSLYCLFRANKPNKINGENSHSSLADVAPLVGYCPTNRRVAGSMPGQGTCLGCRFGPQLGRI